MISIKNKFIFIHIPKTAGNSIQNILRDYSEDSIVCRAAHQDGVERFEIESKQFGTTKHSTLNDYKNTLPSDFYADSFKFTCVRNPWDRMISFYFSPHRAVDQWNRNDFIKFIHEIPPALNYLKLPDDSDPKEILGHIDYFINFNQLDADFRNVCDRIGISSKLLPVRNKAKKKHYSDYYDEELINIVGDLFSDEIALFDYSF